MKRQRKLQSVFFQDNALNLTLSIISNLLFVGMNICLAFMLKLFTESIEKGTNATFELAITLSTIYAIAFLVVGMLRKRYVARYHNKALSQFKNHIFSKLLNKSIAEFESGTSAKFLSAFSNDLSAIESGYLSGIINIIYTIVMFAAAGVVLILFNPIYGCCIVALGIIAVLISVRFGSKLAQRETETAKENMGFIAQTKDLLSGFVIIKSFKAEKAVLNLFKNKNSSLESTKQKRRETVSNISILCGVISILINVVIYGLGFVLALYGYLTIGVVIGAIQLGNYIIQPVYDLGEEISGYRAAVSLIRRLEEAVDATPATALSDRQKIDELKGEIAVSSLSYAYEKEPVLKNISLTFDSGKSYAIVGGSGCGKSTLLKLLLGYMSNYEGSIRFDSTDIKRLDLDSLYDGISIIQQDVFLFDSSIENNITMFKQYDRSRLELAIQQSGLAELVAQKGLAYDCGEGGANLSGGEKQRVSIARCLLRETPVLLADEATAALDNETAMAVESSILGLEGITKIIVTHRFNEAVMQNYDEIIVMNHGSVVEKGRFDKLMEQKGYFYSLYTVAQ